MRERGVNEYRPQPFGSPAERLVAENMGWLRGWLKAKVRDPETAADLCQDSLLKALRSASVLRDPGKFASRLYRIAQNTLRDHLRREKRRRSRIQYTGDLESFDRSAPSSGRPEEVEEAEQLLEAIGKLPERLREPLLLRHSRGLSYGEIASILGVTENAVQVRVFRARKRLLERFGARARIKEAPEAKKT